MTALSGGVPAALREIVPALEYALLQAEMTFDPLIRDGHAGGKREHNRMVRAGIAGTPSLLTLKLRDALATARLALSENTVDSLDDAWREAAAALPEEWTLDVGDSLGHPGGKWEAAAQPPVAAGRTVEGAVFVNADTPAAALHALAARLTATAASDASEEETNG